MKFVLIIGGPSGVGKSSVAQALWIEHPSRPALVDLDAIRQMVFQEHADSGSLALAHEQGLWLARSFLQHGRSVIVERIFERPELVEDFRRLALAHDTSPIHVLLLAQEETRMERHRRRAQLNLARRGVSEDYIRSLCQTTSVDGTITIDTTALDIPEVVVRVHRALDEL